MTLGIGATQQFAATVDGSTDHRITWTATGGTISSTGLLTAGVTPGTFDVYATSVADASAFARASVTIPGSSGEWLMDLPIAEVHVRLVANARVTISLSLEFFRPLP